MIPEFQFLTENRLEVCFAVEYIWQRKEINEHYTMLL